MGTFLCSKEYFVMEHDFYVGIALACVLTGIVKQVGPGWTEMINKELGEEEAELRSIRQSEIDSCKNAIAAEEGAQANAALEGHHRRQEGGGRPAAGVCVQIQAP